MYHLAASTHRFPPLLCNLRLLAADAPEELVSNGRLAAVPVSLEERIVAVRPASMSVYPPARPYIMKA